MPRAAPVLCSCGRLKASGARCQCQPVRVDNRAASHRRGYDKAWEVAAKAYLSEPANRLCQCGRPAVLVAHRISIRRRPDLRLVRSNWRPSCRNCNARDIVVDKAGGVASPLAGSAGNHVPQAEENSGDFSGWGFVVAGGDEC